MVSAQKRGRVLVVAGSDSGGGAGVQADMKAIQAQGAYATTAIAALTAQNTQGVQAIFDVPPDFVAQQIASVLDDIGTDIVKTGMLASRAVIEAVAEALAGQAAPMIIDPVMVASSGDPLLRDDAVAALQALLVARAFLVTPNLPEAALLTARDIETLDDMKRAADRLMDSGARAALIKGGHGRDAVVYDLLAMQSGFEVFEHERLSTPNTHGTGCSLASALAGQLAAMLAESDTPPDDAALKTACAAALDYVHAAILAAPDLGRGDNKPLWHGA